MAELAWQPPGGLVGLWRRLTRRLGRTFHVDVAEGSASTLLLAGSGRSGTTWLAEVLNHDNAYRYLFEPGHPDHAPYARGLPPRPYARPGSDDPRLGMLARAVVLGKARDGWTDQYNRKLVARRRLVKDIWLNLLLGWLAQAYPRLPIVLVLRHPCAVADSQFHTQWGWRADPTQFLAQPQLMEDHLERYRAQLARQPDPFHDHVITWCVETVVPLRSLEPGRVVVAFYEQLWSAPEHELRRVFAYAGRPWRPNVLKALELPSAVARRDGTVTVGRSPVEAWRSSVSEERMRRTDEILGAFGLDGIYRADDPMPLMSGENVLAHLSTG